MGVFKVSERLLAIMDEEMLKVISEVDTKWPKDYIIRHLYVKMSPFFKRDIKYFLASPEMQKEEYEKGFINRGRDIVCSTLADYYIDIFAIFHIRAKKIIANNNVIPLYAIIVEGDHGWFYLDPINDLFNNQYGLETNYFGHLPAINESIEKDYPFLISFSKEYTEFIDRTLHLQPLNMYTSECIKTLQKEMLQVCNMSKFFDVCRHNRIAITEQKLQFFSDALINIGKVNGPLERKQLYEYLIRHLFDHFEKKHATVTLIEQDGYHPKITLNNPYEESTTIFEEQYCAGKYILERKKFQK